MATNEMLVKYGTQLLFADHATDFGAAPVTAANSLIIGSPTDVQMNMSVIADGTGWQSAKIASVAKVGSAWPQCWVLGACLEHTATPAISTTVEWYWNPSPSATAGTGNSGGTSGADAAYTVTAANVHQLIPIGVQVLRNNVLNIEAHIGKLRLPYLYGSLVMVNNAGVAMVADGDADEIHAVLTPIIPDAQAAA